MPSERKPPNTQSILRSGSLEREPMVRSSHLGTGRVVLGSSFLLIAGIAGTAVSVHLADLTQSNTFLHGEVAELGDARLALEEKVSYLTGARQKTLVRLGKTEASLEASMSREAALENQVSGLENTVDVLVDTVEAGSSKVAGLEKKVQESERQIADLRTERARLVVANFDLRRELGDARGTITKLGEETGRLADKLARVEAGRSALMAEIEAVTSRNIAMAQESLDLQRRMAELTAELEVMAVENEELREESGPVRPGRAVALTAEFGRVQDRADRPRTLD